MSKEEKALEYWKESRKMFAFPTLEQRRAFFQYFVLPRSGQNDLLRRLDPA